MILEGIVTTMSGAGDVNIAPMGPLVNAEMTRLTLRPFRTAQTFRNLREHGEGVFHVTDDVLLLARTALGVLEPRPPLIAAAKVNGWVLEDSCRAYEFRVVHLDERDERARIDVNIVHMQRRRDFVGFNRGKHAIVEAAILATRTDFLPLDEIEAEYRKLAVLVDKTGGPAERQALAFLQEHLRTVQRSRASS